jgi:hypothetical protein
MKTKFPILCVACVLVGSVSPTEAQNTIVTYQGRITDNGTNFTGTGQFEFALVTSTNISSQAIVTAVMANSPPNEYVSGFNIVAHGSGYSSPPTVTFTGGGGTGASATSSIFLGMVNGMNLVSPGSSYSSAPTVTLSAPGPDIIYTGYWGNDGSGGGGEPATSVPVTVNNGLFTVALGDTTLSNMASIPASLFEQPNLQLLIWFDDGVNGFAELTPAQNVTAAPYSAFAAIASNLTGTVTEAQLPTNITASQLDLPNIATAGFDIINSGSDAFVLYQDVYQNFYAGGAGSVSISDGSDNTATGSGAFGNGINGSDNTAYGAGSLFYLGNGSFNTAVGDNALIGLNTGSNNIALGYNAGSSYGSKESGNIDIGNTGTVGESNVIRIGSSQTNTFIAGVINGNGNGLTNLNAAQLAGSFNGTLALPAVSNLRTDMVMAGSQPLVYSDYNGKGSYNTAFGDVALELTSAGSENTAIGYSALYTLGYLTTKGGTNNIALGYNAGSSYTGNESSNIDIGNVGKAGESNVIHIGTSQTETYLAGLLNGNGGGITNLDAANLTGTAKSLTVKGGLSAGISLASNPNVIYGWDGYLLYSDNSNNFFADYAGQGNNLYTASNNIAIGVNAMVLVQGGSNNISIGIQSMYRDDNSPGNVAIGGGALYNLTGGLSNIAIGYYAGSALNDNEADNIDIGNLGQVGESETIRIGSSQTETYIAGVINGNGSGLTGVGLLNSPNAFSAANSIVDTTASDIALNVAGNRTGNYNSPVGLFQNLSTASGVSPALRVGVGPGSSPSGALSVSAGAPAGTANSIIAQFGNSSAFVLVITNEGPLYSAGSVYAAGVKLTSDRNAKENFAPLNVNEVLDKVAALPLSEWNYTNESVASRHMGPMAQDFHSAFGLDGDDDTHISVVDEGGVALAAIQGLNQKLAQTQQAVKDKDAEIRSLKQQNDSLAIRLNELETAVKSLQAGSH